MWLGTRLLLHNALLKLGAGSKVFVELPWQRKNMDHKFERSKHAYMKHNFWPSFFRGVEILMSKQRGIGCCNWWQGSSTIGQPCGLVNLCTEFKVWYKELLECTHVFKQLYDWLMMVWDPHNIWDRFARHIYDVASKWGEG